MTSDHRKQSQFELFPHTQRNRQEQPEKSPCLLKDLTLSQENIIVLCIVLLMICILFFSFGVERGKRVAGVVDEIGESSEVTESIIVISDKTEKSQPQTEESLEVVEEEIIDIKQDVIDVPVKNNEILQDFYTVQVASFKLEKNAQKEADTLKDKDFESFVVPKGNHSIVCVGKFIQRERAKALTRKLKKKYNDCLVRRL